MADGSNYSPDEAPNVIDTNSGNQPRSGESWLNRPTSRRSFMSKLVLAGAALLAGKKVLQTIGDYEAERDQYVKDITPGVIQKTKQMQEEAVKSPPPVPTLERAKR